jgi:hypothetical protein
LLQHGKSGPGQVLEDGATVAVVPGEGEYVATKTSGGWFSNPGTPIFDRIKKRWNIGTDDCSGMVLTKASEDKVRLPVQVDERVDAVDESGLIQGTEELHAVEERCLIAESHDPDPIKLVEYVPNTGSVAPGKLVIDDFQTRVIDMISRPSLVEEFVS